MKRPHGIYPILYAFFDIAGELDRAAFRQQVDACIAAGAHGIAILGLITEVAALSPEERNTLVRWAVEDIAGRVPLMATIAGKSLGEAVTLATSAEALGASQLVLQPPLGARLSSEELVAFYSAVMREVHVPVGIQNAPEFLGAGLAVEDVLALRRRHEHFTLMKGEGPVAAVRPYVEALGGDFAVFNGRGGLELVDNLLAGCAGMIPAPDCADVQVLIFEAVARGDLDAAMALYQEVLPYIVFAMQSIEVHVLCGKRMFARRAAIAGETRCRLPKLQWSPFLDAALARWSARFGPYGTAPR